MNILIFHNKNQKSLTEQLKETESIEEVAQILRPYRTRTVFLEIINTLLNDLSEFETENKKLKKELKEGIELL